MADIKDKVVTVESLSALHEHNKETYMTKDDPVGNGSLSINRKANTTVGQNSVTLGSNNEASGHCSISVGQHNIAAGHCQHVQGEFNIKDTEDRYVHIVGNGNTSTRSNAHTLDWDGNAWYQGDVYVGGNSQDDGTRLVKSTNVLSIEYGDTLPAAGTVGRVFFKKVTE